MIRALKLDYLKFVIPFLIIAFLAILPRTIGFQNAPGDVSIGILLDLLVTIPLLYLFLIKNTKIPKFTVLYTFIGGLVLASFIIPPEHQYLLSKVKIIAIRVIEIGIISLLIYKMTRLSKSLKNTAGKDFYDNVLLACNEVFPNRVGNILATEIAVFYYLIRFRKKKLNTDFEFTYYKKSGIKLVVAVFLFLISIETIVVHILVAKWNPTVAWILSFIGLYTMIQIVAILNSMNKRLITIDYENECIKLRYGFGSQTTISFNSISRIEKSRKVLDDVEGCVSLSLFDMLDSRNIVIHLNEENTLQKIYGIEKKYKSISLFVDERDSFVDKIENLIVKK